MLIPNVRCECELSLTGAASLCQIGAKGGLIIKKSSFFTAKMQNTGKRQKGDLYKGNTSPFFQVSL